MIGIKSIEQGCEFKSLKVLNMQLIIIYALKIGKM